jgi:hypothetical protein
MKITSSDIQMVSSRVYSEMQQKSETLSTPTTQPSQEAIVDKVTLSQQQLPEDYDSTTTSESSSSSSAAVSLEVEVSLFKKTLSYQKELFYQLLNMIS